LMVRLSGFLPLARGCTNRPEWTDEGPQNGPQFLTEFLGSLFSRFILKPVSASGS